MNSVVLKAMAVIALTPLSLDVTRRLIEARLAGLTPSRLAALFVLSRVTLAVTAFQLLRMKLPSDAAHYYATFGQAVLTSGRTLTSPYSPGFDFLMAGLWWLFPTPLIFVWTMIAAEAAAFGLTLSALRLVGETSAPALAVLWLVSPISVFNVALGGQDEALIVLATAGVLWAVARQRDRLAGAWVAGGLAASKVLAGFAAVPLLTMPGTRLARAALAGGALSAIAMALFAAAKIPVLSFLVETQSFSSGNLWALAALVSGRGDLFPTPLMMAIAMGALVLAIVLMRLRPIDGSMAQMLRATGTTGCVFLLFSPKSFASYLLMFLPGILFLLLTAAPLARTAVIVAVVPMAVLEPSLWFNAVPTGFSLPLAGPDRLGLLAADAVLLAGYGGLAWRGLTLHRSSVSGTGRGTDRKR